MILNIDLHTHTNRYSPCSILSPEALCETALACGLHAVAITEHHYAWSAGEIASLQARYPALKLYAGVEISCTGGHDYVAFGLPPGAYPPMTYREFRARLDRQPWSFAYLAHPFRYSDREDGLAALAIDGIEMGSYNMLERPPPADGSARIARAALYRAWRDRMGWLGLCNSDGHSRRMIGTFYTQLALDPGAEVPRDEAALVALLREIAPGDARTPCDAGPPLPRPRLRCVCDRERIRQALGTG